MDISKPGATAHAAGARSAFCTQHGDPKGNVPLPLSLRSLQAEQQEQRQQQHSDAAQPRCMSEDLGLAISPVARVSDKRGLRFGNCITFQHVGSVSPTSAPADAGSAPGQAPQTVLSTLFVSTHSMLVFTALLCLLWPINNLVKTISLCSPLLDSTSSHSFMLSVQCSLSRHTNGGRSPPSTTVCRLTDSLQVMSGCHCRSADCLCDCAERSSGPSAGPTMSLCNWLPPHSAATTNQQPTTLSAAEGSSAHHAPMPPPSGHMQSRQQFQAVSLEHQVPLQQQHLQQHGVVGDQMCGEIGQQGQASWQLHAKATSAQRTAERKRRQCLLEIERELLRHSSDEDVPPDDIQLPPQSAGKRRKTACTGEGPNTWASGSNG